MKVTLANGVTFWATVGDWKPRRFRSTVERNFAEGAEEWGLEMWYEPFSFIFERRYGTNSRYTPDFLFKNDNAPLIEVKPTVKALDTPLNFGTARRFVNVLVKCDCAGWAACQDERFAIRRLSFPRHGWDALREIDHVVVHDWEAFDFWLSENI